jgi:serine/threonine protein kinase
MPLSVGDKLGHYEVLSLLGQGGMGEVYRAKDTKLDRDVAIKVLPQVLARDPERLARFEREAKVLASLDHPNIGHIHGIVDSEDSRGLVLALIEGPTLADRIEAGPIPLDEAVAISKQVIEALEYAHDRGVVHRDLKPANIKITSEGVVKVLDFGLAKVLEEEPASSSLANSPTLTLGHTRAGVILGTAAYMSPEQAVGRTVDRRSDIFSFGAVLYEMLTGKRAFLGAATPDVLEAVVKNDPDWSALPVGTPVHLRRLLERTLAKDRKQRLQAIGEARIALENSRTDEPPTVLVLSTSRSRLRWLWPCVAALFLLTTFGVSFIHFRETPSADPVLHLSVSLPGNAPVPFLALSPDGRRLAISLTTEGKTGVWLRPLDLPQLQFLPGTENARSPFWSPDSKFIGFFADGKLKTIPASGGPPQALCDGTGGAAGGTWNRDGVILFSTTGVGRPLQRVNASGGACTAITKVEGGSSHRFPEFLPDGKHFVYVVTPGEEAKRGLYVASLDHPDPRRLIADESSAVFVPSTTGKKYGYLLFLRGNVLMAQPFSAETLQLAGDTIQVATEASFSFDAPQIAASASASGTLVYEANLFGGGFQLTWLGRSGKELGNVGSIQIQRHVALSPDGKTVSTVRSRQGMWLHDVQRGGETRFISPATSSSGAAVWSPEGNRIAFGSGNDLYLKDASGDSKEELLLANEHLKSASDWSRDGRYLIYTETERKGQGDIWYLPDPLNKSSEKKPVKFQGTEATESQGQLSPDGRWLAYVSNESGQNEVYVRPFPSGGGRWKVSAGQTGSLEPRWGRDGKELFFVEAGLPSNSNRLMAVAVQPGPRGDFQAGAPQALFEFHSIASSPALNMFMYSPSADGQRFLVNVQSGGAAPALNVISNWEKAALRSN